MHLNVKDECWFSQAQTSQIQSMRINFSDGAVDRKLETRQASVNTEGKKTKTKTPITSVKISSRAHASDQCSYSSNNLPKSAACQKRKKMLIIQLW